MGKEDSLFQAGCYPGDGARQTQNKNMGQVKNVKNEDILRVVCLSRALNLFGDMDPLGRLVKLLLRILLVMT